MKQIRLTQMAAVCLVATCLFASCASDDVPTNEKSDKALVLNGGIFSVEEMKISSRGVSLTTAPQNPDSIIENKYTLAAKEATRTPMDATPTWAGMAIRNIAVQAGGNVYQYSVDASGKITCASPFYFTSTNNTTVNSWYPYTASYPSTFSVQTDQTSYANYEKSDFLFGSTTTANQSNLNNSITYNHKIAKLIVKVNVSNANYMIGYGAINSVSFTGARVTSTVGANGALTASGGTTSTVKMYTKVASARNNNVATATYEACVIPQSAKLAFTLNIGGITYTASMASANTFAAGVAYELTINISSAKVYISSGGAIAVGDYLANSTNRQAWVIKKADISTMKTNFGAVPIAVIFSNGQVKHGSYPYGIAMALKNASTTCTDDTVRAKNIASGYNVAVPNNTSGWFLPDLFEWRWCIYGLTGRQGGANWKTILKTTWWLEDDDQEINGTINTYMANSGQSYDMITYNPKNVFITHSPAFSFKNNTYRQGMMCSFFPTDAWGNYVNDADFGDTNSEEMTEIETGILYVRSFIAF
ncbi:MAG: fimbrillin family protein [Prevotella sp.]|nr:fimbrillin family protein [Prevotella sp.]